MPSELRKLIDVLRQSEALSGDDIIYVQVASPWSAETLCAVIVEDEDNRDVLPPFAVENGLEQTLDGFQTQDVVSNAAQQKSELTDSDLINAFRFYFERDAFIVW